MSRTERRTGSHETLEVDREYLINEGTSCESRVLLLKSGDLFCTVRAIDSDYTWETMNYRLTDIPEGYTPPVRKHISILDVMSEKTKKEE
jgi:hypothetical protein